MRILYNVYYAIVIIAFSMFLSYWIAYFTDITIVSLISTLLWISSIALAIIIWFETAERRKKAKKRKKKKVPLV